MNLLTKITFGQATLANQEEALQNSGSAYYFARLVEGADIEKCQEIVCKDPFYAYRFARDISGADIEKCQEVACKNTHTAYRFACNIPEANIQKCIEACKGTEYESILNEYLMEKALI